MIKQSSFTLECFHARVSVHAAEMPNLADAKMESCQSPAVHSLNYFALSEDIASLLSLPFSVAAPKTVLLHHRTH